ncbi:unnamed protein product [Lactuca virosa]|uniref:Cysteine-rich transmembrane CYSTM domain-containing protein n=1 Tax=Lactuca virosa TaxID=75947 RepID=A0AAU9M4V0_9ASTR|nr:unnamed protein product [Lactuca virosa]
MQYSSNMPQPEYATGVPAHPIITPGQWSTGLCDCGKDVPNCCLTCWCPCISFGRIAEVVDKGTTSCGVSGALYSILCLFTGCECYRELKYRGFEPSLGWQGNLASHNQGIVMPPIGPGEMKR